MKIFAYYAIMDYYNRVVNFDALLGHISPYKDFLLNT